MKRSILILLILISIAQLVVCQNYNKEIKSIRDRYYRIHGGKVDFKVLKMDNYNIHLEDNELSHITFRDKKRRYEFYYDRKYQRSTDFYVYFAYFKSSTSELPDLRAYYDDIQNLILYKQDQDTLKGFFSIRPDSEILFKALNAMNSFLNIGSEQRNKYSLKLKEYDRKIDSINKIPVAEIDTVDRKVDNSTHYSFMYDIHHKDKAGNLIKRVIASGWYQGWTQTTEYKDKGILFCSITQSETTIYRPTFKEVQTFYANLGVIKKITYDSKEINLGKPFRRDYRPGYGYVFEFDGFIPRIEYY